MFYDNFLKLCNQKKIAPSAALQNAGIDKSAGTRWKNGHTPTDATLQKLVDYFGVSKTELLQENSSPAPEGAELPAVWASLSEEAKAKALEYMQMLKALEDRH